MSNSPVSGVTLWSVLDPNHPNGFRPMVFVSHFRSKRQGLVGLLVKWNLSEVILDLQYESQSFDFLLVKREDKKNMQEEQKPKQQKQQND